MAQIEELIETDDDNLDSNWFNSDRTDENEDEMRNIARDQIFTSNIEYLLESENVNLKATLVDANEQESLTPNGFLSLARDGKRYLVRKSSLLWMLDAKTKKVSTDRLRRFISDAKKPGNSADDLVCGDFIIMEFEGSDQLCQVLGFRYITEKRSFTAIYCPINVSADKARGVEVFVNFFTITNNCISSSNRVQKYINILGYKRHVNIKRDNTTNELILIE